MLADSEAMFVDSLTYLFNMLAERWKYRASNEKELAMSPEERQISRRLYRLHLELIPPCISVVTLLTVTVNSLKNAITTLLSNTPLPPEDSPNVSVMMIFSVSNSILDIINVACFVHVDHAFLSPLKFPDMEEYHLHEACPLVLDQQGIETVSASKMTKSPDSDDVSDQSSSINLNMCSAWTVSIPCMSNRFHVAYSDANKCCGAQQHVFADTLRSMAVLSAACIAYNTDLVSAEVADAVAAVIVSFIILLSCLPLTKGLLYTAMEIRHMHRHASVAAFQAIAV